MKVIAKKNTSKLIKGLEYDVLRLQNSGARGYLYIKVGNVSYMTTPNNFTDVPKIDWVSPELKNESETRKSTTIADVRTLKKGDVVICNSSTKFFEKGKMYKVDDILFSQNTKNGYLSIEQKIKIEGYNRWMNKYRFRMCTPQEKRELSLSTILDETDRVDVDFRSKRKIDRYDVIEKKKIILDCLFNSIFDESRHQMTILDWALEKKAKQYDIQFKDIKPLLNMKLSDILKALD